ncbi:MAG TPA: coproporphyrinogen III oxidase, partial [Alphaproteobacteria bacterium]|nr:coproporphyrinogen III oxidase [Alphaproteobacteria bacterium]
DAGLPAYEISNHARPGGQSRHNLVYWRYGDYAGIGPGAHGRLSVDGQRIATANLRKPERWLSAVRETGVGREERSVLRAAEQASEMLIMGLRLMEGISLSRYEKLAGVPLADERITPLVQEDLLWRRGDRIGTTGRGQLLLDAILRELSDAI